MRTEFVDHIGTPPMLSLVLTFSESQTTQLFEYLVQVRRLRTHNSLFNLIFWVVHWWWLFTLDMSLAIYDVSDARKAATTGCMRRITIVREAMSTTSINTHIRSRWECSTVRARTNTIHCDRVDLFRTERSIWLLLTDFLVKNTFAHSAI